MSVLSTYYFYFSAATNRQQQALCFPAVSPAAVRPFNTYFAWRDISARLLSGGIYKMQILSTIIDHVKW